MRHKKGALQMVKVMGTKTYVHFCANRMCEEAFTCTNKRQKYCSSACRQAAYEARIDPEVKYWRRKQARAQKIVESRRGNFQHIVCVHCQQPFKRSNNEALRIYCSPACRQAAYRERKKGKSNETLRPLP
jgi:hypothetical protein